MPARKNPAIFFEWRNSSGCDFLQGMAEINLQDSITILGWITVLRNKIYAHMQKSIHFISIERLHWLWFLAPNGIIQYQGKYEAPGLAVHADEQNLCLHAKILSFQWRNSSGCDF